MDPHGTYGADSRAVDHPRSRQHPRDNQEQEQSIMVLELAIQTFRDSTEPRMTFVCPLCGTTFSSSREVCSRCGGYLVVPVDESEVYETVLPMCGPDCHPELLDGESDVHTSVGLHTLLSRLTKPSFPECVSTIVNRDCLVTRRV